VNCSALFFGAAATLVLAGCPAKPRGPRDAGATRAHAVADGGSPFVPPSLRGAPDPWPPETPPPARSLGAATGTLRIRLKAEPPHLNVLIQPDHAAVRVVLHTVFETLLEERPNGRIAPSLARESQRSPDGLRLSLWLRKDARWHDGRPLTSADVQWTLERVLDPKSPATTLRANLQHVRSVEAPAPDRIVLHYSKVDYFALRALTAVPILPKHIYATGDLRTHAANRAPTGSGPYRFVSWTPGREIVLARVPPPNPGAEQIEPRGSHREMPGIASLRFVIVREDTVAALLVRRGELDLDERAGNDAWLAAAEDAELRARAWRLLWYPPGYAFRVYNTRHPALADRRVRTALSMLTDRSTILREVHRGLHRAVHGPYPPESPCAARQGIEFSPERAAALLREAGYGAGQKRLTLTWLIPSSSKTLVPEARIFAADARRAGVDVSIETVDWPAFQARLRAGNFDMAALAWFTSADDDLFAVFHSSQQRGGLNYGGYSNAGLDRVLERLRTEMDPRQRLGLCARVNEILAADPPYTFLYQLASPAFVAKHVGGIRPSLTGFRYSELWLTR
jgi:peptide/nickel transport system substrate-binding protein